MPMGFFIRFSGVVWLFLAVTMTATCSRAADMSVAQVRSGDEMVLTDGRVLRLEGVVAPKLQPLADQARDRLREVVMGRFLTVTHEAIDRYGRITGQVYAAEGNSSALWVQGVMLKAGMALIYPPSGLESDLTVMGEAENEARQAQRGLWSDPAYVDLPAAHPEDWARNREGSFVFVRGTVADAVRVKNKIYLNFGPDWRRDFTVTILARDLKNFRHAGVDPLAYKGQTIRVRGWATHHFGPMINVVGPWAVENID